MALEDILRRIREDAEAEAHSILGAARAEQDQMLESARERAAAAANQIRTLGQAAAVDVRRKELATAGVEVRRTVLQAKQQVLGSVFETALQRLSELPDAEYSELLKSMALRAVQTGDEHVLVSGRDRSRLGPEWLQAVNAQLSAQGLPGNLEYADQDATIRGGLILRSADMEINCSFERTLASLRDQLEPEVAALLFSVRPQEAAR